MDSRSGLPVNTVLDGSYRIVRVVGSGGFGITYEAEDIKLAHHGRHQGVLPLRLRRPRRDHERQAQVRPAQARPSNGAAPTSCRRRARSPASSIPSIVRVTRVFEANSTAYMVMRFEQGQSFEDWLTSLGRPPTQEELDRIVAPLLDALQMMHAREFPASRHRPRQHHRARRRHARCCSISAPRAAPWPR